MGRAIVRDPQVFLYDEPLSNLDAKLRVAMRTELKELHQRLKTTSVYVTHDQIEAMTMGDQIVVMKDGRIEQTGSAAGAVRPPGQPVRGRLHRLAGDELPARHAAPQRQRRAQVELADGTRVGAPANAAGSDGQPVIFGTRPEHLALDGAAAASRPRWWWSSRPAPTPSSPAATTAPRCRWCSASATASRPAARSTCGPTCSAPTCSTPAAAARLAA